MPQPIRLAFTSLIAAAAFGVSANAAVITGVTATASSQLGGQYDRAASHVVDGSGFYAAAGTTSTSPDGAMWLTTGNGSAGGTADTNPFILFDLGAVYNLSSMSVWNYNEAYGSDTAGLNRGIASLIVSYGNTALSLLSGNSYNINKGSGTSATDYSTTVSLTGLTARYVELSRFTHFANSDNDFFGLSEVRFDGTLASLPTAVPEPASLALLGAGLIGAGFIRRNRKA